MMKFVKGPTIVRRIDEEINKMGKNAALPAQEIILEMPFTIYLLAFIKYSMKNLHMNLKIWSEEISEIFGKYDLS